MASASVILRECVRLPQILNHVHEAVLYILKGAISAVSSPAGVVSFDVLFVWSLTCFGHLWENEFILCNPTCVQILPMTSLEALGT